MAGIADDFVEELKARVNIVELAGRYTKLQRRGRNWVGLSPFTDEKTPSFNVLEEKGIFKCFSSGKAGDLITLVRELERLEFVEAIEFIANAFNLPIRYTHGTEPTVQRSLRREIEEIQDYAADFYHRTLMGDGEEAAEVRRYWVDERQFSIELAQDFRVGYAPAGGFQLNKLLIDKGFSTEALRECGLFYTNSRDRNPNIYRHRFRGRLIVPIRDTQGRIVAFTARVLAQTPQDDPTHKAKYLNSPETVIFHKSRLLFNLDRARHEAEKGTDFLMVEGQLDALRCWSAGLRTAVAPQGTSVTEDQLKLLRRYHGRVDVVLDGDRAGQTAALRILPLAFAAGIECRFVTLPENADPDTFLCEHGAEALEAARAQARSPIAFAVAALLPESNPTPASRGQALNRVAELLRQCDSEVTRSSYLMEAADLLDVNPEAALADARRLWFRRQTAVARPTAPTAPEKVPQKKQLTRLENDLLWSVLLDDRWASPLALVLDDRWLDKEMPEGRILGRILAEAHEGTWDGSEHVEALLETPEERSCYYGLAFREDAPPEDMPEFVRACVQLLANRFKNQELRRLTRELADSTAPHADVIHRRREVRSLTEQIPYHLLNVEGAPA